MIFILITYFYVFFISLGYGLIMKKWIDFQGRNVVFIILTGFFVQLLFSTVYALFLPLNEYFYLLNASISILILGNSLTLVKRILKNIGNSFRSFSTESKLLFLFSTFLALLHSSSLPFIVDNESYYIQTIKWLNHYGLVKGLVNLHLFLGQFSGWHILQSSFNFGFLPFYGNDLNGFLFILLGFYSSEKWNMYRQSLNKKDLFVALFFIFSIFLVFFVPSPSPDLPVIVILPIIVMLFVDSCDHSDSNTVILVSILSLLAILIKITAFPVLLFPLLMLVRHWEVKTFVVILIIAILSFSSWTLKNIFISGYPLYPSNMGNGILNLDWKANSDVYEMSLQQLQMTGFQLFNWEEYTSLGFFERLGIWLKLPGIKGIMNKIILFTMIGLPFFIRRMKEAKYLYLYFVLQFLFFINTSPQYRFFLPALITMGMLIAAELLYKRLVLMKTTIVLSMAFALMLGLFGGDFSRITNNDLMKKKEPFILSQLFIPRSVSQFESLEYKKYKNGNLEYYSPVKDSLFFWQTSDGPLPCANREMIDYFSLYYDHVPQLRTEDMKDGFKSSRP